MTAAAFPSTKIARAIEHARLLLTPGPMLSVDFATAMFAAGFTTGVQHDARRHLGVKARLLEIHRRWELSLPADNDAS